jgi:CubicO group peptidase (beta-lactamase class C family)
MTPGEDWPVAAPEVHGMDAAPLAALGRVFTRWTEANVHAVLVARHGVLLAEHYFAGEDQRWGRPLGRVAYDAATPHDVRSVSKSVVSLLVGIGLQRGWLPGLDASITTLFPGEAPADKAAITVRHLLTMSAGLDWNEDLPYGNPANSERRMTEAADRVGYVLQQPLLHAPGSRYRYNGGLTTVLAAALCRGAGQSLDALARQALFEPLGITSAEWVRYADGAPVAASGLRLRARDLARIGQLVLQRGAWAGRQVVPEDWIAQSLAPQINGEGLFFYGYQWWLGRSFARGREISWAAAFGWGGQRLFVVPSLDLVVVILAGLYGDPALSPAVWTTVLNRHVLPAVRE